MTKSQAQDVIRIFLIDEEDLVRSALASLIKSWDGFTITREATVDEAVEQLPGVAFDVVLLSLAGCEEADGGTVKAIARKCADSPLVVLVGDCAQQLPNQLIRFGAVHVVLKNEDPSELRKVIQSLHHGNQPDLRLIS